MADEAETGFVFAFVIPSGYAGGRVATVFAGQGMRVRLKLPLPPRQLAHRADARSWGYSPKSVSPWDQIEDASRRKQTSALRR